MANVAMVVTNACDPDPRVINSARWLSKAGHNVTIHAYDRLHTAELESVIDGVLIKRYQLGKSPYGGMLKTAIGIRKFHQHVLSNLLQSPPNIVVCHDADTLAVGCKLKKKRGTTLILDMHDLQHTWVLMPSPRSKYRKIISKIMKNRFLRRLPQTDLILTSSGSIKDGVYPGLREWLMSHGFQSTVIENRPVEYSEFAAPTNTNWVVSHIGRIRDINSIRLLFSAIKQMPENQRPDICIAGDGPSWEQVKLELENFSNSIGLNYDISGSYDRNGLTKILQKTNVMYAMYDPMRGNILDGALPVKMFDAAAHNVPSVVNSDCLMGELCEQEQLGKSVEWDNSSMLVEALLSLRDSRVNMDKTALDFEKHYLEVFSKLLLD